MDQWGGPYRNFHTAASGLRDTWPASGPRVIWNRSHKLITLDQDGDLMIAHPSPQGFTIAAKAALLTRLSWTPPVLVGTRLYVRDRRSMMAVDLS